MKPFGPPAGAPRAMVRPTHGGTGGRNRVPDDWYQLPLPANVEVGEGSWIHSAFAFRHFHADRPGAVRIGRSSGIYIGSFFDIGPTGRVSIGDYSTLVGVIVSTNAAVRIGSYCFLAHEVVIADTFAATPWRASSGLAARDDIAGGTSVSLGDDVWIGAGAVLLRGARLGDGVIVGAGTVVDFEVPAYAVVAGNPARIVGTAQDADLPHPDLS